MSATRRQAIGTAGGVALLVSAGPLLGRAAEARGAGAGAGDAATLLGVVRLEQASVVTYRTGASSGALDTAAIKTFTRFAGQEQAHLDAVTKLLEGLGSDVPALPPPEQVEVAGKAVSELTTQPQLLAFAAELEQRTVAAYYQAQQSLHRAELLRGIASIMANEGQHLVVLRTALNRPPVPNAFATGRA